ncbi:MAG: glycogen debranching protein GlgX [Pseudomonadota bacterium]
MSLRWGEGRPDALGLRLEGRGANVAVHAPEAERVELCLFSPSGRETARLALPERTGGVWHGFLPGVEAGALYGFRAHGPWAPGRGRRFNPAKLLLDPYALAVTGDPEWSDLLRAHSAQEPDSPDPRDSAGAMPRCVAVETSAAREWDRPRTSWSDTVIYEAHVRALTKLHPGVPEALRGTWEALGCEAVISHLRSLGVTALELLPGQAFMDERHLVARGLRNHWGYNPYGWFIPSPRYAGPRGLAGLQEAVARLHAAGIEVILDVVCNHTAESDADGPVLHLRGLDDAGCYRHAAGAPGGYVNDTGCGNTLNAASPFVRRIVRDSLRWWAEVVGIDGFRFDLGPVLGRGRDGAWRGDSGLLAQLRDDPVIGAGKLIAEPWDLGPGGYALGEFPPGWAEWNDRFRDSARGFWKGAPGAARGLGSGLLGSAELFDEDGRPAWSSVNYVASHDGFTLADQTMYARKRNRPNGEGNRDGHAHEVSDPMGPEGPGDAAQEAARARRRRNLLLTVFAAQGTPMLRAGDELGQSQSGNNNAYCQDNATTWIDWETGDAGLLAFVRAAAALRRRLPALRQRRFLHAAERGDGLAEVEWRGLDGGAPDWGDGAAGLVLLVRGAAEPGARGDPAPVCLALNAGAEAAALRLPEAGTGWRWVCALDTGEIDGAPGRAAPGEIPGACARVFEAVPERPALARLADRMGILDSYREVGGALRETGDATRRALLHAMGVGAGSEAEAARELAAREAEETARLLPYEAVIEAEVADAWRLPAALSWRIGLEEGGEVSGAVGEALPPLPPGVHALRAGGEEMLLAAAPPRAPGVAEAAGKEKVWGATAALYGLVSARSLGRGDFADLAAAAESLAGLGADFLGINPVHALGAAHEGASPYSPSSRAALDTSFVAPDRVAEFADCPEAREILARHAEEVAQANAATLTDPALRARVAGPALRALFDRFEETGARTGRAAEFEAWLEAGGEERRRFALFEALSLRHGEDWRDWPGVLRDPEGEAAARFAREEAGELRYHAWLQWLAEGQLAAAQRAARGAGMALGLYLDIAVGVRPGGAETWARPAAFARGVALGAPPDALNPQGQDWGLAPFDPEGLRRLRYAPFREMLRAAMGHAGMVRIDHVMGLARAYWTPRDGAPGGYVRYPLEMLLALARIEAARAGCVVVGEDLGTVPRGLSPRLASAGLHGCAVLQFEGGPEGFRAPRRFPRRTLASFGTHDLPTLAGWWEGADIALRRELGWIGAGEAEAAREARAGARAALAGLMAQEGVAPEGLDLQAPPARLTPELADGVHALLAGGRSALVALQLDDALGETAQQNVPGTVDEAPNWRRRHRAAADALGTNPALRRAAAAMRRGGRG